MSLESNNFLIMENKYLKKQVYIAKQELEQYLSLIRKKNLYNMKCEACENCKYNKQKQKIGSKVKNMIALIIKRIRIGVKK